MQKKLVITYEYLIEDEDKLIAGEREASIGTHYIEEDGEEHVVTAADYNDEGLSSDELRDARRDWVAAAGITLHPMLREQDQDRYGLKHMGSSSGSESLSSSDRLQMKLWEQTDKRCKR